MIKKLLVDSTYHLRHPIATSLVLQYCPGCPQTLLAASSRIGLALGKVGSFLRGGVEVIVD